MQLQPLAHLADTSAREIKTSKPNDEIGVIFPLRGHFLFSEEYLIFRIEGEIERCTGLDSTLNLLVELTAL